MAYDVVYEGSVSRDLAKMDKAEAGRILQRLEKDPAEKAQSYRALKGKLAGLRKYRVGEYRVVYTIIGQDVVVLRIGDSQDMYRLTSQERQMSNLFPYSCISDGSGE